MKKAFDLKTTTSFVIANMIGVGVFVSLGYQLAGVPSVAGVLLLWIVGGIASLCGALSYVALASLMPRSGGEYHYVRTIYGDVWGFIAGFVTVVVGFGAPLAASAIAFATYSNGLGVLNLKLTAILAVVLISLIHSYDTRKGGDFHFGSTIIKMVLIVVFIVAAFLFGEGQELRIMPSSADWEMIFTPAFVISFIYVTYAYTGWNASVYILDEVEDAERTIPISLLLGTGIVMFFYVLINYTFMYVTPMQTLLDIPFEQKEMVAQVAAESAFGKQGGMIVAGLIAIGLIAALSSMLVTGSRVVKVMAEDYPKLGFLQATNERGAPQIALFLLAGLACFFILTATFDAVINYAGFILCCFGILTILGLFVVKYKNPAQKMPFGSWFFPFIPIIYLLINFLIVGYMISEKPMVALVGVLTVVVGFGMYLFIGKPQKSS